jgi:hypothetical protein
MILHANLPEICDRMRRATRALDVGGWFQPFNLATHVLDIGDYATRRRAHAIDPENPERFTAESWVTHDACTLPWPFPDKYFDFSFCSHLLEDVRDPIGVCRELSRVSRAGYVEVPPSAREIFTKDRFVWLKLAAGMGPRVGFPHHRWFVERSGDRLLFTAKTAGFLERRDHYITRAELGRKMNADESGLALFWDGAIDAVEQVEPPPESFRRFKADALSALHRNG